MDMSNTILQAMLWELVLILNETVYIDMTFTSLLYTFLYTLERVTINHPISHLNALQ